MTNLERLKMAVEGINLNDEKLNIYLLENDLKASEAYEASSSTNKKQIYKTALGILEDIANNPQLMKSYKTDDITISQFSENLQNRIAALERKIRMIADDDNVYNDGASFIYMFSE
ncbi:hypothetical protein [Clostridium ganghwense]|uniref:Uncharacterized protein n=1 Tax=Clostridium ganghwense TaxID=312089 RepID=A0ABT4CUN3_9CLOT|nr:hypothetical protein [Clostridium ganghwense]MCY6372771.1 hypothetical protein [Clostridium ganghwense]